MAAPAFRSKTDASSDNTNSITVTKPAGTASGDVLILTVTAQKSGGFTLATPSGWTVLGSETAGNWRSYVFWKAAGGSEPANYTVTADAGASIYWLATMLAYSGANTVDVSATTTISPSSATSFDTPSVTTTVADTRHVIGLSLAYQNLRSFTAPGGYTKQTDHRNTTVEEQITVADAAVASAGATGIKAFTCLSQTCNEPTFAWSVALKAAASPPVANFTGTPLSGDAPLLVTFTDTSTGAPTSWSWDFGDSGTSTTQNPTHTYTVPGVYTVELDATNAGGTDTEAKVAYVTVTEPPIEGICLAPDDGVFVATPTWERIDTSYNVQSWSIDRGRQNEMGRIDTGTARIELVDRNGDFDPTNPAGAFYGRLETGVPMGPLVQAAIALEDPVDATWSTLFRGFVSRLEWVPYRTLEHANVTLELVDGLALLAACEMAPDGSFGDEVFEGNIVFHEDTALDAIQTRINLALDQAQWPAGLRSVYTGNVGLWATTYAPRTTVLSVIQDAADAEFPDIALAYVGGPRNPGELVFRGRYARFHPDDATYDLKNWQAGDDTSAATSPGTIVRVSPPLVASLDDTNLYTSALATNKETADGDIAGQYVTDPTAVIDKGLRTWSAESLLTAGGEGPTTANAETKLYAAYVRDNMATPQVRVGQLTIKSRSPGSFGAAATWELLTNIDLNDVVHLTTVHGVTTGGGGGFDHDFFVEGIHYQASPGGLHPYVELTLDVSPRGYYDSNPFE